MEKSIRGSTYQSMIEGASSINQIFIENPKLADLWGSFKYVGTKGNNKKIRQAWIITMMMDFYENMYFQHEQGNIPEEIWQRWKLHIINVFKVTKVKKQWNNAKVVYYKPFRDFIDTSIREKK